MTEHDVGKQNIAENQRHRMHDWNIGGITFVLPPDAAAATVPYNTIAVPLGMITR